MKTYRYDVQILRGFAVIAVVLFHASEHFFPNGYLGVDIFFVISGFVITPRLLHIFSNEHSNVSRLTGIRTFYISRFWRLAPALFVTLSTVSIALFLLAPFDDQEKIGKQGVASLLILGNLGAYKYSGNYFSPNPNPLVHTWSLSVEEQIYILLPMLMAIMAMLRILNFKRFFIGLTIFSFGVFLFPEIEKTLFAYLGLELEGWSFYSPLARIWEFSAGSLLHLLKNTPFFQPKGVLPHLLGFTLSSVLTILVFLDIFTSSLAIVLTVLCTSFLIHSKYLDREFVLSRLLQSVGDWSYSIYLLHMPLLYLAKFGPIFPDLVPVEFRALLTCCAVIATLFFGRLMYTRVEIKYRRVEIVNKRAKRAILLLLLNLFLYCGMFLTAKLGFMANVNYGKNGLVSSMSWDANCDTLNSRTVPACQYSLQSPKYKLLLLGDSHGAAISQVVYRISREIDASAVIATQASCPFISDDTYFDVSKDCTLRNSRVETLVRGNSFDAIIYFQRRVSNHWESDIIGGKQLNQRVSTAYLDVAKSLKALNIRSKRILILGLGPERTDEPTRIEYLLGRRSQYIQNEPERNIYKKIMLESGFSFLDLWSVYCPEGTCESRDEYQDFVLEDRHHLSLRGASLLKDQLKLTLLKIIESL